MGAGGREFHNFNVVFRGDRDHRVVAFTAAQIPGIADRVYPASLAGPLYPDGIPIRPEEDLERLIRDEHVDEVVFAYSDLSHEDVMHRASLVLAAGADFRLMGPGATVLRSRVPVIAVCAVRTGCGKSQTTRYLGRVLVDGGFRVAVMRHPMAYGDLEHMRVQRFATLADIDASDPTIEEREEYEAAVDLGMVVHAGIDYAAVLRQAEAEADVVIWDGGNNDFPFLASDLFVTVVDPLRPGHELRYHPGETNVRLADVVVVNKADRATGEAVAEVVANVRAVNRRAVVVQAASPVTLEDGPTITHGGMPFGAGTVAARDAGAATLVDPRPYAAGSIARIFAAYPAIGPVLPAMGYSRDQLRDLEATIQATPCDVVVSGTPIDLARLIDARHPVRRATYELRDTGAPTLAEVLAPHLPKWRAAGAS